MTPSSTFDLEVERLAAYLSARTGLTFHGSRARSLRDALRRRTESYGGVTHALGVLESNDQAFGELCHDVTVQESHFFRESAKLEILRSHVLPELTAGALHRRLRLWSAGCAAGEEAYTLAMLLSQAGLAGRYQILGTDLSPVAISKARGATYSGWALRGVEGRTLSRGFTRRRSAYQVREEFRHNVAFQRHNLLDPLPPTIGPFDVIFCRNVLIYLSHDAVSRVAAALVQALVPGGWLITSSADPLLEELPGLEPVVTEHGLAYRRVAEPVQRARRSAAKQPRAAPFANDLVPEPLTSQTTGSTRQAASAVSTDSVRTALGHAELALQRAKPDDAERLVRPLLNGPEGAAARQLLVQALAQDARFTEAVDAAEQAVKVSPDDPEAHQLHAIVLLESNRLPEARAAARRALYLNPRLALAHLVLGRVHEGLADEPAARRARRNAQRLLQEAQRDGR